MHAVNPIDRISVLDQELASGQSEVDLLPFFLSKFVFALCFASEETI